jgi:hypothetical protein
MSYMHGYEECLIVACERLRRLAQGLGLEERTVQWLHAALGLRKPEDRVPAR